MKKILYILLLLVLATSCEKDQTSFYVLNPEEIEIDGAAQDFEITVSADPQNVNPGVSILLPIVSLNGIAYESKDNTVKGPCFELSVPADTERKDAAKMHLFIEENDSGETRVFQVDIFCATKPCRITQLSK